MNDNHEQSDGAQEVEEALSGREVRTTATGLVNVDTHGWDAVVSRTSRLFLIEDDEGRRYSMQV